MNTFAVQNLTKVPDDEWLYKASTGRSIRTMCIEADLWNSSFQYAGFFLRLTMWVNSNTSGPTGRNMLFNMYSTCETSFLCVRSILL